MSSPEVSPKVIARQGIAEMLLIAGIEKYIYIDDLVGKEDDINDFLGLLRNLNSEEVDVARLVSAFPQFEFDTYSSNWDVFASNVRIIWSTMDSMKRRKAFQKLYRENGDNLTATDIGMHDSLKAFFPSDMGISLNPIRWETEKSNLLSAHGHLLILIDQDLSRAGGDYEVKKGQDLIVDLQAEIASGKVVCALFTHTITEIQDEIAKREEILETLGGTLSRESFFPLAKIRKSEPGNFADGIRKVLLNRSCERVKANAKTNLLTAFENTKGVLDRIDPYVFDHIVFQSSYKEGVWEYETMFRLFETIFFSAFRDSTTSNSALHELNPQNEEARKLSRVNVGNNIPYFDHLGLRQSELFEKDEHLSKLNIPLANGDIFEATDGELVTRFILVGQECDLVLRVDPLGQRNAKIATLLPLKVKKKKDLDSSFKLASYQQKHFRVPYYEIGSNGLVFDGEVSFDSPIYCNLDVLDLIHFGTNGNAELQVPFSDCIRLIHFPLRKRLELLSNQFESQSRDINTFRNGLDEVVDVSIRESLLFGSLPSWSFPTRIGKRNYYENGRFTFGLRRVGRLRNPYSSWLLEKFSKYISRYGEPHDFAK